MARRNREGSEDDPLKRSARVGLEEDGSQGEGLRNQDEESIAAATRTGVGGGAGVAGGTQGSFFCTSNDDRWRLVDMAFDEIGVGRYHWMLLGASGTAFFIEAAEMNLVSLLLPEFERVWATPEERLSIVASFTGLGMVTGALAWGRLADVLGRTVVFQCCVTIVFTFGFMSSFAWSIESFAFSRLLLGFGYGGNTVSASTMLLESVPTAWRGLFSALISLFYTFGALSVVVLAWVLMDAWGWQWVVRVVSLAGIPALVMLLFIPGTVRFSVTQQDYTKAVKIVHFIAAKNRVPVPAYFTVENLRGSSTGFVSGPFDVDSVRAERCGIYRCWPWELLCSRSSLRTLVPLLLVWFTASFGMGFLYFTPLLIEERFPEVEDAQYKSAFALGVGGIAGSIFVSFLASRMNRKSELRLGMVIMGTTIFLATHLGKSFDIVLLCLVGVHFGMAIMYHGLYTYTPEVFPTAVRATSFSICQVGARLAPVISPFVVTALDEVSLELCGSVFGAIFFLAALLTCTMYRETFGKSMVENVDTPEAEGEIDDPDTTELPRKSFANGIRGDYTVVDLAGPTRLVTEDTAIFSPESVKAKYSTDSSSAARKVEPGGKD